MKQTVRTFSIGLFTAGIIMAIGLYFFDDKPNSLEHLSAEEMIPLIKNDGYHVLSSEEYIAFSVNKNANSQEPEEDEDVKSDDQQAETNEATNTETDTEEDNENTSKSEDSTEDQIVNYSLSIESGMPTSSISVQLAENGIIDNASEFTNYLEEHDYTLRVQMGTHQVSSAMSFYELAEAITK